MQPIELGFVTHSLGNSAGGILLAIQGLAEGLSRDRRVAVKMFGVEGGGESPGGDMQQFVFHAVGPAVLGVSPQMARALKEARCDLHHTHGIWQGPSWAVLQCHKATKTPYLVSPHGMLDPWAVARSRFKKWLVSALFEKEHLAKAACLHALSGAELKAIRAYNVRNPVCVIPNGVEMPADFSRPAPEGGVKTLLYLGRLHPKKGLTNAIKAWQAFVKEHGHLPWRFVIAGWDQSGHEAELKQLCREAGLAYRDVPAARLVEDGWSGEDGASVLFVGSAFGTTKEKLLAMSDAFILPSHSEGLPMAVLEAWAYGLPVLMTEHCNLPEGFAAGAAFRVTTEVESLRAGLSDLREMSASELIEMGRRGRSLVEERFTWSKVADQMCEVYEWVLGRGGRPETVDLHCG